MRAGEGEADMTRAEARKRAAARCILNVRWCWFEWMNEKRLE